MSYHGPFGVVCASQRVRWESEAKEVGDGKEMKSHETKMMKWEGSTLNWRRTVGGGPTKGFMSGSRKNVNARIAGEYT